MANKKHWAKIDVHKRVANKWTKQNKVTKKVEKNKKIAEEQDEGNLDQSTLALNTPLP